MIKKICVLVLIFTLSAVGLALAHPADSYVANDPPAGYGEQDLYLGTLSFGDLEFTQRYPEAWELTEAERYIIAGARNGRQSIAPWQHEVFMLLLAYHSQTGEVPPVITDEVLAEVSGDGSIPLDWLETIRSPITGELPRTDAASFAPGQVYFRFLTDAEMQHLAQLDDSFRAKWFSREWTNPETKQVEQLAVVSRPVLFRVYGEYGVVFEELKTLLAGESARW